MFSMIVLTKCLLAALMVLFASIQTYRTRVSYGVTQLAKLPQLLLAAA